MSLCGLCCDLLSVVTHAEASAPGATVVTNEGDHDNDDDGLPPRRPLRMNEGLLECLQRALDFRGEKALPLNCTSQSWKGKRSVSLNPLETPFQRLTPREIKKRNEKVNHAAITNNHQVADTFFK